MSDELTEITAQSLKEVLDGAFFNATIQEDGEILVQERFRTWISLGDDRFIRFRVVFQVKAGTPLAKVLTYANTVNDELIMVRATGTQELIIMDYYLWCEGGALKKNVVLTYRVFARIVESAIGKDTGDVLA